MGLILEARSPPTFLQNLGSGFETYFRKLSLEGRCVERLRAAGSNWPGSCRGGCSGDDEQIIESSTEALRRP